MHRLSRIAGQIQGLRSIVEDDTYCIDLIDQVNSVNQALKGFAGEVMEKYLKNFVRDAIHSGDPYDGQDKPKNSWIHRQISLSGNTRHFYPPYHARVTILILFC